MKNKSLIKYNLLFLSAFIFVIGSAQVNVHLVTENFELNNKQGVFYALPRTMIRVDVSVEKTEYYAGPYSEYAGKYLDLDDVITNDFNEYSITDVKLSSIVEPDPENFYFVEFDEKATKDEKAVIISLSESGLIMGLNGLFKKESVSEIISKSIDNNNAYSGLFQYYAETNLVEQIDTIIKKVVVDTVSVEKVYFDHKWVEKDSEEKAVEAANMISKIRENRFNLITGYQEIAYDAGSMTYMSEELKKMEEEYLSLFTGITIEKTLHYSFTVLPDPEKESTLSPVFVFSVKGGIKDLNSAGGEKIYLRVEKPENAGQIASIVKGRNNEGDGKHGFYYRIPVSSKVSIEVNNDLKVMGYFNIAQYGIVTNLPSTISAVQFHPETGGLKNIIVE